MDRSLRRFVFALLSALALGLLFRVAVSPARVEFWLNEALDHAESNGASLRTRVQFENARLSLGQGLWPRLALQIERVVLRGSDGCAEDRVALDARTVEIPIRWLELVGGGRLAAGVADVRELAVDVDAFRPRCGADTPAGPSPETPANTQVSGSSQLPAEREGPRVAQAWWSERDAENLARAIRGARVGRAQIYFEQKSKHVDLERAGIDWQRESASARFRVRLPSAIAYGETLPPIDVNITATPKEATAEAYASFEEGRVRVHSRLRPLPEDVDFEARAEVSGVAASVLAPLIRKSGLYAGAFKPRFLWFGCSVSIHGPFRRLFQSQPLEFRSCALDGSSGRLEMESATRLPNGNWGPFVAKLKSVDVRSWFEAFGHEGPRGVFVDFGKLDGTLEHLGAEQYRARGSLSGARAVFVNRDARAFQEISLEISAEKRGTAVSGRLERAQLIDGRFDGTAAWNWNLATGDGALNVDAKALDLASGVQAVMIDGRASRVALAGRAEWVGRVFRRARVSGRVEGVDSAALRSPVAEVKGDLTDGVLRLTARSARMELATRGAIMEAVGPLFADRKWDRDWISVSDVRSQLAFTEAGMGWDKAHARVEDMFRVSSSGNLNRDRVLAGVARVESLGAARGSVAKPGASSGVKILRYSISGRTRAPEIAPVD